MRLLDTEGFQRDYLEESYEILKVRPEDKGAGIPLVRPTLRFYPHQIVGIRWMVEMEASLAQGGLLADECGLGKVGYAIVATITDTNSMQTATALGMLCYQIHEYESKISQCPKGHTEWRIQYEKFKEQQRRGEIDLDVRPPREPKWELHRPTLVVW